MLKAETLNELIDSWLKIFTIGKIPWKLIFKTFTVVMLSVIVIFMSIIAYKITKLDSPEKLKNLVQTTLVLDLKIKDSLKLEAFKLVDEIEGRLRDRSYYLLNALDADRTTISTFHNGTHTSGGLDYRFCNIDFEKINYQRGILPIAFRYKNMATSDFPMMTYLKHHSRLFIGTPDLVEKIDYNYAYHLRKENVGKLAVYYLQSNGISLGVLTATWHKQNQKFSPDSTTIANTMINLGEKIEPELEFQFYANINK